MTPSTPASQRFKAILSGYGILIRDDRVLLLRRANTGYEDGKYGLPSGHLDGGEQASAGTAREVTEEIGVVIDSKKLECVHVMHRLDGDERADFFFVAREWSGEPENKEPEKCDDLSWHPLDALPANIIPYVRFAIEQGLAGSRYSEYGW